MAASDGEMAVAAMVQAARQTFDALQQGDEAARAERVQAAHAEYEQLWSRVRQAAEAVDALESGAGPAPVQDVASDEVDALLLERRELRIALAARNRDLKEQVDGLRQLLFATSLLNASRESTAAA